MIKSYPEYEIQKQVVAWARHPMIIKQYPGIELLYSNENAGRRTLAQQGRFKASGGLSGVPDLFLPVPKKGISISIDLVGTDGQVTVKGEPFFATYHGLYIELKSPKGRLTDNQKSTIEKLRINGYRVEVCKSSVEAINVIEEYMKLESI